MQPQANPMPEDSPSGLWRTLGKRVGCKPSGVRIPHPPPHRGPRDHTVPGPASSPGTARAQPAPGTLPAARAQPAPNPHPAARARRPEDGRATGRRADPLLWTVRVPGPGVAGIDGRRDHPARRPEPNCGTVAHSGASGTIPGSKGAQHGSEQQPGHRHRLRHR